jgi:hypothetical protein
MRVRRKNPRSLLGMSILMGYPALFALAIASTFFVHRLKVKVWGGGAQLPSTEARVTQMKMGLPLILRQPYGYGPSQGAVALNYHTPAGRLTIDNYYLALILDYGIVGLALFLAFISFTAAKALLLSYRHPDDFKEGRFFAPISLSMVAFLTIKAVFSQVDNHPVVFMIIGLLIATAAKLERQDIRSAN